MARLVGLATLFAAGLLLAGGLAASGVADVTTTETLPVTTTLAETTTAPPTTVVTTVEQTTTEQVTPTTGTTTSASSENSTPTWVWVVLAILAAAVIGLLVAFLARRGGISAEERQRRLDAAVATWAAQGWAIVNQTPGSATMSRGSEVMVVSVDAKGQVDARSVGRP
jgi:anti-sigma-K factor RskA